MTDKLDNILRARPLKVRHLRYGELYNTSMQYVPWQVSEWVCPKPFPEWKWRHWNGAWKTPELPQMVSLWRTNEIPISHLAVKTTVLFLAVSWTFNGLKQIYLSTLSGDRDIKKLYCCFSYYTVLPALCMLLQPPKNVEPCTAVLFLHVPVLLRGVHQ